MHLYNQENGYHTVLISLQKSGFSPALLLNQCPTINPLTKSTRISISNQNVHRISMLLSDNPYLS